jgi:hypothetical protein
MGRYGVEQVGSDGVRRRYRWGFKRVETLEAIDIECPQCGRWFTVEPGTRRDDAMYDTDACKSRAWRARNKAMRIR